MNFKLVTRLAFAGAAVGACAWLAAGATSTNRETIVPNVQPTPIVDTRGAALADEISRLHEHLRPSAAPRQPGRNLFSFLPRQAPVAPSSSPPSLQKPALSESIAARPAAPVMKLSGIAEDVTAGGVVRTAIISTFGQLFVVKEGELVTERYRVTRISADVAELSDVMDGTVVRIALR
jgi:hypothetical protein